MLNSPLPITTTAPHYKYQYWRKSLIILIVLFTFGCSSNPTKEDEAGNSYDNLYQGSSENKTANEAAIAAETPEEAIARGDEAYSKGQYDIALYEYVDALKLNGGDTKTLNKVGDIHYTLEDYDSAAGAYNASIQLEGDNQHALLGLGLIQLRTRKYDQAKANLTQSIQMGENSELWLAYNGLGTMADIAGDYSTAIEHYRNALRLNPNSPQVLNNLGYSEYLTGNWHRAMMHFVQAVNSDINFERAWYNIGLIYTRQGKYEDAFDAFRNVLDTPQAYNDIGYLCMLDGYYDVAEHYYQKAIKTSPSYYLKAHENIDRLERQRERGSPTQLVRTSPRATPTTVNEQTPRAHDNVIAVNEAGVPVVTIAQVSSAAIVDNTEIASANDVTIVEKKESEIPVKSPTATSTPRQSSLTEISQPTAAATAKSQPVVKLSETSEINTQPKVADTAVSSTTDTTLASISSVNNNEPDKTTPVITDNRDATVNASVSNSDSNKKPASYSTQGEQADYRKALALVRDGEFEDAAESFNSFLEIYPESSYADNANYWIGETYYVTRDFEPALETFTGLVKEFPDSPKVPDTRLKIGYIHYEQHDWSAAHEELSSIVSTYPDTEVAQLANARLKRMEDEGH